MKPILFFFFLAVTLNATAQKRSLHKIWETDSIIAVPESVLPEKEALFVTLIDGPAWGADGRGGVGKLTPKGKVMDTTWVTGLHAPKGMGRYGNRLYVADITNVVVINISTGKIEKSIPVEQAQALNDITVSEKGTVYVSDSRTGRIWKLENDTPTLYLENMTGVNGLKALRDDLYIASGKSFIVADANKRIKVIAQLPEGGDGVEPVGNGDFIVTSWVGLVYYVTADGQVDILLDTREKKKNTADIGFDAARGIVYVPTFNAKTVAAYQLRIQ